MNSKLKKMLDKNLSEIEGLFGGKCSIQEIKNAEVSLSLVFSRSYKEFLRLYGAAIFDGYTVYGLKKLILMDDKNYTVVDKTKFYKETQKWPDIEDWYIISDDGRGNPIGCKPDGSVWLSDHDSNFEQIKLANDFEEFLHKLLTDTLYEENT